MPSAIRLSYHGLLLLAAPISHATKAAFNDRTDERPGWKERCDYAELFRLKAWMLSLKGDVEAAANLHEPELPLLLPGMRIDPSPTDYRTGNCSGT